MWVHQKKQWNIPSNKICAEQRYLNRREILSALGCFGAAAIVPPSTALLMFPSSTYAAETQAADADGGQAQLYPARRNPNYPAHRRPTAETIASRYNNFYEFGSHKQISERAQALITHPWRLRIDGEVETPIEVDAESLIQNMGIEERVYRHRCVEAWSMVVPWTGFALHKLLALARPLSHANYVQFQSFMNADIASGQRQRWYPWPYTEALTIAEATTDLAFVVTGAYGKPMAKQFGAPLRLALPWKYGFKSIKSIQHIRFTRRQPTSFWEHVNAAEYGFWANVNPDVPHPRWSQATERDIGTGEQIPTQIYNGYGAHVAHLYKDAPQELLFR